MCQYNYENACAFACVRYVAQVCIPMCMDAYICAYLLLRLQTCVYLTMTFVFNLSFFRCNLLMYVASDNQNISLILLLRKDFRYKKKEERTTKSWLIYQYQIIK